MTARRIVFVGSPATGGGGMAESIVALAAALASRGHQVELWVANRELAERARPLGVDTLVRGAFAGTAAFLFTLSGWRTAVELVKAPPDVIIHHTGKLWLPFRLLYPRGRQFVLFHSEKLKDRDNFRHWLAFSDAFAEELRVRASEMGSRASVNVVGNTILATHRPGANNKEAPPGGSARSGRPVTIGTLAELRPEKRIDMLINAFTRLVAEGNVDAKLVIAGDGPDMSRLKRHAEVLPVSDRIEWLGWVTDKAPFFDAIDVFALTSKVEPFGLVILEAMLAGRPVVATATNGARTILDDGRCGVLAPIDDAGAFSAALKALIEDPERQSTLVERARARARDHYSLKAVAMSLESAIFQELNNNE